MKEKIKFKKDKQGDGYNIITNFIVEEFGELQRLLKNLEGIEFCFVQTRYKIYISWNELFNEKEMIKKIIGVIKVFIRSK